MAADIRSWAGNHNGAVVTMPELLAATACESRVEKIPTGWWDRAGEPHPPARVLHRDTTSTRRLYGLFVLRRSAQACPRSRSRAEIRITSSRRASVSTCA